MWVIVGLGNPGPEYDQSRHNVGFLVVDKIARRAGQTLNRRRFNSNAVCCRWQSEDVVLVKPQCFMNESGRPVAEWLRALGGDSRRLVVVHDDMDIKLGRMKVVAGGGAAGHRGVESIQEALQETEFPRIRVGIGRPPRTGEAVEYVLSTFSPEEAEVVQGALARAADAATEIVTAGVERAMNRFNARPASLTERPRG